MLLLADCGAFSAWKYVPWRYLYLHLFRHNTASSLVAVDVGTFAKGAGSSRSFSSASLTVDTRVTAFRSTVLGREEDCHTEVFVLS